MKRNSLLFLKYDLENICIFVRIICHLPTLLECPQKLAKDKFILGFYRFSSFPSTCNTHDW